MTEEKQETNQGKRSASSAGDFWTQLLMLRTSHSQRRPLSAPVDFSYRDRLILQVFRPLELKSSFGADCRAGPKGGQSWRAAQIGGIIYRAHACAKLHLGWRWPRLVTCQVLCFPSDRRGALRFCCVIAYFKGATAALPDFFFLMPAN
jgi:hypothetical protein